MTRITACEAIDLLGGVTAVARLLDIKPPSVHEWRSRDAIPSGRMLQLAPLIETASHGRWRRWDLRPDDWHLIWPELVGTPGAPAAPAEKVA